MYFVTKICCFCLNEKTNLINLSNRNFKNVTITNKVMFCVKRDLDTSKMTVFICKKCCNKLEEAYEFKKMSLGNFNRFEGYIRKLKSVNENSPTKYVYNNIKILLSDLRSLDVKIEPESDDDRDLADHGQDLGDHGQDLGDHGQDLGDHGQDLGDHGQDLGDPGQDLGDNDPDSGDFETVFVNTDNAESLINYDLILTDDQNNKNDIEKSVEEFNHETHIEKKYEAPVLNDYAESVVDKFNSITIKQEVVDDCGDEEQMRIAEYQCTLCERSFNQPSTLKRHMISHKKKKSRTRHQCLTCKKIFKSPSLLKRHMASHNSEIHKCSTCDKIFTSPQLLNRHLSTHENKKIFQCSTCEKTFDRKSWLERHVAVHVKRNTRAYKCTICFRRFVDESKLNDHMAAVHTTEGRFSCSICQRSFWWKVHLIKHMDIHSRRNLYECTICGSKFNTRNSFSIHKLGHKNKRPHVCKVCDRKFCDRRNLKSHLNKRHPDYQINPQDEELSTDNKTQDTEENCKKVKKDDGLSSSEEGCLEVLDFIKEEERKKPISCEICNKRFKWKSDLQFHMVFHSDNRPFSCTECDKSFKIKTHLRLHMSTHSNSRFYSCSVCDKSFKRKADLSQHAQFHSNKRPHLCSICGRGFQLKHVLDRHMISHTGLKPHLCTVCGKGFSIKTGLSQHMLSHMKDRPVSVCSMCNAQFKNKNALTKHMKTHEEDRGYPCYLCNKAFFRESALRVHITKLHPGQHKVGEDPVKLEEESNDGSE